MTDDLIGLHIVCGLLLFASGYLWCWVDCRNKPDEQLVEDMRMAAYLAGKRQAESSLRRKRDRRGRFVA